jgi:hypothetical protein
LGVVANREAIALDEGNGAGGGEEEDECVHNSSIGCFKQNLIVIGLGKF